MSDHQHPTLEAQLTDLRGTIEKEAVRNKATFESLSQQIEIVKEVEDLKRQLSQFRTIGIVCSLAFAAAGFYGFKSLSDFRTTAEQHLNKAVEDNTAYYSDLLTGYAYVNTQNFRAAIPILQECFETRRRENKQYDASVLAPLVMAYNETDDWESAENLIQVLEKDSGRLAGLKDPWLFNNVGQIRIEESVDDPGKLSSGVYWLGLARQLTPIDDGETAQAVLTGLWMSALVRKDLKSAKEYLSQIPIDDSHVRNPEPWQEVSQWRFSKTLFKKYPDLEGPARTMWNQERDRILRARAGKTP